MSPDLLGGGAPPGPAGAAPTGAPAMPPPDPALMLKQLMRPKKGPKGKHRKKGKKK